MVHRAGEGIKKKNFDRSEGVACSVLYPAGITARVVDWW